jgi:kynureninase
MGDTLSIKVYQALASALEMNPERRVILSDTGNFPSDLYMAEGCAARWAGIPLRPWPRKRWMARSTTPSPC